MKILIATDGSAFSDAAIEECCRFFPNLPEANIKIVSVYEEPYVLATEPIAVSGEYYQQMIDAAEKEATNVCSSAAETVRQRLSGHEHSVTAEVMKGPPEKEIIDLATAWGADLIVVGSHGRGFWGRMIGSVSNDIVHHAPCSVLVVRTPHAPPGE